MKIYEKIRLLRKTVLNMNLKDFHKKLCEIFGDKALTYHSLCRLEKGHREDVRISSLYQICTGLGISLKELKEGTDAEESKIVTILHTKDRFKNRFVYNEKANAEILNSRNMRFLATAVALEPGGATDNEEDPLDANKFEKLVIMLQGKIVACIGNEKHLLKKGDTLSFASNILHHFENPSATSRARLILVQNPKSY
ncbi:MAG: cupin domain-containing protein [Candidatus Omnitrophota bacterium]